MQTKKKLKEQIFIISFIILATLAMLLLVMIKQQLSEKQALHFAVGITDTGSNSDE